MPLTLFYSNSEKTLHYLFDCSLPLLLWKASRPRSQNRQKNRERERGEKKLSLLLNQLPSCAILEAEDPLLLAREDHALFLLLAVVLAAEACTIRPSSSSTSLGLSQLVAVETLAAPSLRCSVAPVSHVVVPPPNQILLVKQGAGAYKPIRVCTIILVETRVERRMKPIVQIRVDLDNRRQIWMSCCCLSFSSAIRSSERTRRAVLSSPHLCVSFTHCSFPHGWI